MITPRGYLIFDTETSTLPNWSLPADHPDQPRLAEIALICIDAELRPISEIAMLVKADGWRMDPMATAVNRITDAMLEAEGQPLALALDLYGEAIEAGFVAVAFGARFDTKIMRGELRRAGRDDLFEKTPNICLMDASKPLCKLPPTDRMMATGRKTFKTPNLAEAYRHFVGEEFPDAHRALPDAKAALAIFMVMKGANLCPEPRINYAKAKPEGGAGRAAPF
jgi:DNA polymerase III subunit epsilon